MKEENIYVIINMMRLLSENQRMFDMFMFFKNMSLKNILRFL